MSIEGGIVKLTGTLVATLISVAGISANAAVTQKDCQDIVKKLRPEGEKCLAISAAAKRQECTQAASDKLHVPDEAWQTCRSVIDPLKNELVQKEHAKYPNQASAFDSKGTPHGPNGPGNMGGPNGPGNMGGPNGPGNMGGPNGPGNMGGPNGPGNMNGMNHGPAMSSEQCQKLTPGLKKQAESCVNISSFDKRHACFDKVATTMPPGFFDSCHAAIDPIQTEIQAKEKAKYPNQASAIPNGPNNGPGGPNGPGNIAGDPGSMPTNPGNMAGGPNGQGNMNGGPNGPRNMNGMNQVPAMSADQCQKHVPNLKKLADNCLRITAEDKRRACFDKIGEQMPHDFLEGCRATVEPVKQEYIAKEKAKHPNQASTVDSHNGGPNAGPTGPGNMNSGPGMMNGSSGNMAQGQKMKNVDCGKLMKDTRDKGMKCVAISIEPKRKDCGDKVGKDVEKNGGDMCRGPMDQLHREIQSMEHQKYPTQNSVL